MASAPPAILLPDLPPDASFPRMREPTPMCLIPVQEAAARWVAATGAAMTWVG